MAHDRRSAKTRPGPTQGLREAAKLQFPRTEETKQRLIESAMRNGRSLSEEIEFRINRDFGWEATKSDIEVMKRQALAWADASRAQAIRAAGLQILREITGKPTRVIVDLETLLAEADGIMRGLRPGFLDENAAPAVSEPHTMTQEEWDQATAKLAEIRRTFQEAQELAAAEDAAAEEAARQSGKGARRVVARIFA